MFFMGIAAMLLTVVMTVYIYHNAFAQQQKSDIQLYGRMLANVCESIDGYDELDKYHDGQMRVTVVSPSGQVLYESDADAGKMSNHSDRSEIIEAFSSGTGESTRQSDTMGYNTYYYAMLLPCGDVLRVAMDVETMFQGYNNAFPGIVLVGCAVMVMSIVLSMMLTKSLVKPIEKMAENLDDIDKEVPYKELKPFAYAVKEYQLEKEQNANMRQEFTANVSHELKTPLTSISGYAEMIENGMAKDTDIKVFAGKIHSEAKRLLTLIADILKLSELDEGKSEVVAPKEPAELLEIAKNAANVLLFKAQEAGIELTVKGEPTIIMGNKRLLEEMIYNLCDNAIKYNKPGGKVIVNVGRKNCHAEICVCDTGIGIPKEHQERIFERFYRVDKSRSKATGGTGLGLAIVKHVAMNHNAKIQLKSEPNKGTEIRITFNS